MSSRFYVEKDGWCARIENNRSVWVEARPTYSKTCSACSGHGYRRNHNCGCENADSMWGCECKVPCGCKMIHGVGMAKDDPEHRMPCQSILNKLDEVLSKEMKSFGIRLAEGTVETEIAEEERLRQSAEGACL